VAIQQKGGGGGGEGKVLRKGGGGGGGDFVLLALPAFLPSVISSFLPKIRGALPLDPPLWYITKCQLLTGQTSVSAI